jgi:hypothetical protein
MRSKPVSVMRTISPVCTPAFSSRVTTLGYTTIVMFAGSSEVGCFIERHKCRHSGARIFARTRNPGACGNEDWIPGSVLRTAPE